MNHISPTNAQAASLIPGHVQQVLSANNRQAVQNLTIDPNGHHMPPQAISNVTSPNNAQNNRYRDNSQGLNQNAIVGIHPASTKNQNSRQFNLKRSLVGGHPNQQSL